MQSKKIKIGELNFEFVNYEDDEILPILEIENDASMVFEKVEPQKAIELRDLLTQYLECYRSQTGKNLTL